MGTLELIVSVRSLTLFLMYKSASVITIFVTLILGSISPAYSIINHVTHGEDMSMHMSMDMPMQSPQNANLKENGLSVNNSPKSNAEQIIASCQENDEHCPMMSLDALNKTADHQMVLDTFSNLIQLYDNSNSSCHHAGHHLGMWLYDYTGNLKEALNHATVLCGGSVYHGIFYSYFGIEQSVHHVDKNQIQITNLCPISQENINWLHERDCIHGVGHGLLKLYNYNTTAAVDRCDDFKPLWAQSACSRGIFMGNNDYFFDTGKGDFDKSDNYSPCNKIAEKFAPQCYFYPEHMFKTMNITIKNNLTAAFAQCENISPVKFVKYCDQAIGRILASTAYTNPAQAVAACYGGINPTYADGCLLGTLRSVLKQNEKADFGLKFCSLTKLDFKAACYGIVGIWIKTFFNPAKQELESECAKAPDTNYVANCINAKPGTGAGVSVFEPV
jgi:hypothetical protein